MYEGRFKVGEPVVFRKTKRSPAPGPRAEDIAPEPHGEKYAYRVDKYWVVSEARDNGELVLKTRRGKTHVLPRDHPDLRRPNLLERLFKRHKFPDLQHTPPIEQPKTR